MLEWYFPWAHIDWVLRFELITWLTVVTLSYRGTELTRPGVSSNCSCRDMSLATKI